MHAPIRPDGSPVAVRQPQRHLLVLHGRMPRGKPVVDGQTQRRDPARIAAVDAERHVHEQPAAA